jgi:hypothetical protein
LLVILSAAKNPHISLFLLFHAASITTLHAWRSSQFSASKLFAPTHDPSSFRSLVAWWELRRIPFNMLVGATGIASVTVWAWLSIHYFQNPNYDSDFNPILSGIFFAILANVFYTTAWIVEGISLAFRKHGSKAVGPRLFKLGLCFSLILASLPGLLTATEVILRSFHTH